VTLLYPELARALSFRVGTLGGERTSGRDSFRHRKTLGFITTEFIDE